MARSKAIAGVQFVLALASPLVPKAFAQDTIHEIVTTPPNGCHAVAGVGDANGDGVPDFAMGRPAFQNFLGAVDLLSGADASLLWRAQSSDPGTIHFGGRLGSIGDVDLDGVSDLYVLAGDTFANRFGYVISGVDGHPIHSKVPPAVIIEPAGDVDADGTPDWITSDSWYTHPVSIVEVRSGKDASLLHGMNGAYFSAPQVATLGDVDGDGHDDFILGDWTVSNSNGDVFAGAVTLYSGKDGSVLRHDEGSKPWSGLGFVMNRVGDLDGDGDREYAVMDQTDFVTTGVVKIDLLDPATGARVLQIEGDGGWDPMAYCIVDAGDVNGDGVTDLFTGTDGNFANPVPRLWSGRTGQVLYRFFEPGWGPMGGDMDSLGDVNGDGLSDVLIGQDRYDLNLNIGYDVVRVASGNDLWLSSNKGDAWATELVTVTTREGSVGSLTVTVMIEFAGVPMFTIVQGLGTFDATGTRRVQDIVPPGLIGLDTRLQAFALDASHRLIESAVELIEFW